jgi:tetratricopeptide (TPR) repeat protein
VTAQCGDRKLGGLRRENEMQLSQCSVLTGSVTMIFSRRGVFAWLIVGFLALSAPAWSQSDVVRLFEEAQAQEKAGDYVAASGVYEQVLAADPGNLEALKRFGILEQTELKFGPSVKHFKRVLARDPKYPEVNFFLGVSYFGENNFAQAISSFEQELTTPEPHPRCRQYLALALLSAGRTDEAVTQFQRVVADNPKDADALYQLARFYKNASIQAIDKLKALDDDSFQLHALMGEVYADEERYAEATKEYQAALVKRPSAPGIHYAMGIAYWVQHQLETAKKEFLEALKENPGDALTNLYLGDIAVHEERFSEALDYLRIAQKGQPNMPQVHLLFGKCYKSLHQSEKAKSAFLAAITLDPSSAQPHYLLAQVYRDLHDAKASDDEYAEFEKLSNLGKDKDHQHGPQN